MHFLAVQVSTGSSDIGIHILNSMYCSWKIMDYTVLIPTPTSNHASFSILSRSRMGATYIGPGSSS